MPVWGRSMVDVFIASVAILLILVGWLTIQQLARYYAARHPEFGPAKEEGTGCGKSCLCVSGRCARREGQQATNTIDEEITIEITEEPSR